MNNYAKIESGSVKSVGQLPKNTKQVSGFNKLTEAELKEFGYLPVEYTSPEFNKTSEKLGELQYEIKKDKVVASYKIEPLATEEINEKKSALVKQISQKLTDYLFKTDWVEVVSGLGSQAKTDYNALRSNISAAFTKLDSLTLDKLHELKSIVNECRECIGSRQAKPSTKVKSLSDSLKNL
jgi:hypothetical protein